MSSLSAKDRVSLCSFTFSDGRRCRSPRTGNHPHFCFYHAQKEARALAAETLGKDLAYFFSGDYLSACDLSTALARLIPAVVRGDVKPKTAHTLAYLVQTLMHAIHISQHEYINAFGTDGWRKSVRNSVKGNYDYRFPFTPSGAEGPAPEPEQPESPQPQPQPDQPQTQAQQPAPQPAETPMSCHSKPACPGRPASADAGSGHSPLRENLQSESPQPQPAAAAHSLRPQAFPSASPPQPAVQPTPVPQPAPTRDPNVVRFDHTCRLLQDGKPF
jgi:hypothetical protein